MTKRVLRKTYAAGIMERQDGHLLIALPPEESGVSRRWQFPRGPVKAGESPERALQRIARADLDIDVDIVAGQPPLIEPVDGEKAELRYFFCGIVQGVARPGPYAEIRWILRAHLREYEFDEASRPVAAWLVDS